MGGAGGARPSTGHRARSGRRTHRRAGPAIGGRRGRIPAAAGGCGGLPPGAPTPGGGGDSRRSLCRRLRRRRSGERVGAIERGTVLVALVGALRLLRPIIANLHGTGRRQHFAHGIRLNSELASSNAGWRTVDMPSRGAEDEIDVAVTVSITSPSTYSDSISKCSRPDASSLLIPSSNSVAMVFSSPSSIFEDKFA